MHAPWNSQQRVSIVRSSCKGTILLQSWQNRPGQIGRCRERRAKAAELYEVKGGALSVQPVAFSLLRLRLVQGRLFGGGMFAIFGGMSGQEGGSEMNDDFPFLQHGSVALVIYFSKLVVENGCRQCFK